MSKLDLASEVTHMFKKEDWEVSHFVNTYFCMGVLKAYAWLCDPLKPLPVTIYTTFNPFYVTANTFKATKACPKHCIYVCTHFQIFYMVPQLPTTAATQYLYICDQLSILYPIVLVFKQNSNIFGIISMHKLHQMYKCTQLHTCKQKI